MWRSHKKLLIAALSARALAHSAQRCGFAAAAVDVFADQDTRRWASGWARVGSSSAGFDAERLLAAAQRLVPPRRCAGLVYGAGFEACPQTLAALARGRALLGNDPETLARVCDPRNFFAVLDRLGIAHPRVSFAPPPNPDGWLLKRAGSCGGAQVRAARSPAAAGDYFQQQLHGDVVSVAFLGNGRDSTVLGVSEQWRAFATRQQPYLYGGAVSRYPLGAAMFEEVRLAIHELVQWWGLRGLNGLDLVVSGEGFQVLELNARPTATLELYQAAPGPGLFAAHLQGCRGRRLPQLAPVSFRRAHMPVYATAPLRVPAGFAWPPGCSDLPAAGSHIGPGEPLCTLHASGGSAGSLRWRLLKQAQSLRQAMALEQQASGAGAGGERVQACQ